MTDTNLILKTSCPSCGSKDNLAVWEREEGGYHGHCFSGRDCKEVFWDTLEDIGTETYTKKTSSNEGRKPMKSTKWKYAALPERSISLEAAKKYQIKTNGEGEYAFPYYDKDDNIDWIKYRDADKNFPITKKSGADWQQALLFGQNFFPSGSGTGKFKKNITIVEGEFDAPAAWELMGQKGGVVSLKNGAQSVKSALKSPEIYEYLNSFDHIVVCFDNDESGKEATKVFCSAFHPKKIKLFPHQPGLKDANEYLEKGLYKKFTDLWWKAEPYREDGIVSASGIIENILTRPPSVCYSYPWEGLNEVTNGCRKTEMVTITAQTGVGKTQVMREFTYGMLFNDEPILYRNNLPDGYEEEPVVIGVLSIEEDPEVSLEGLGSLHLNKNLHLPDTPRTTEEVREALTEISLDKEGQDRLYFYDQFGSNDIENIVSKIWFMAKGLDCTHIILDHINLIVSDQRQDDERRALDEIATKLKQMTKDLKISLHVVAHQNREGKIRGTAAIEQLSNIIVYAERDLDAEDEYRRNLTRISVKKNRFSGKTGPATWLHYDEFTGRMEEVEEPDDIK